MSDRTVLVEERDRVATITLNRPDVLNAMTENDLATLLRTTEDRVEGARAFVEKRKPRWAGR